MTLHTNLIRIIEKENTNSKEKNYIQKLHNKIGESAFTLGIIQTSTRMISVWNHGEACFFIYHAGRSFVTPFYISRGKPSGRALAFTLRPSVGSHLMILWPEMRF